MKAAGRSAIVIAYFLIYVVWGSTYYFIGVALKRLSHVPARRSAVQCGRGGVAAALPPAG